MDTEETNHDQVNNPEHYNSHPSGIECIEVTRHMNFNLGNAIKYIWRAGLKDDYVEDLEKAIWYLNDEIFRVSNDSEIEDFLETEIYPLFRQKIQQIFRDAISVINESQNSTEKDQGVADTQ